MRVSSLAAVAGFVLLAALCLFPVWPSPTTLLLENGNLAPEWILLGRTDQAMVVSTVMRNADLLLSDPASLRGLGQCFPFPMGFTLGEHAFGEGILAMIPWAVTGDPILSYNILLFLTFLLPGCTMFVWVRYFTGSAAAAFLAGILFQLMPARIFDGGHPFLHADYWLPLAMLSLHRLFVTGRARHAVLLGLLLVLQAFASIYLIIGVFLAMSVYGSFLLCQHPRHRTRAMILSLAVVVVVGGFTGWLLLPYLEIREQWELLAGRETIFVPLQTFQPGNFSFPGWVFTGLALWGIRDRWRGPLRSSGEDPRLVMCVVVIVLVGMTFSGIRLPGTSLVLPPLLSLLSGVVPGLDAVRALSVAGLILVAPLALLAGFGARALLQRESPVARGAVFAVLLVGIVAFRFVPAFAGFSFGPEWTETRAWSARPDDRNIALARSFFQGALAEIPLGKSTHPLTGFHESGRLLLNSYAPQPTTSCYNSFGSPYQDQMFQLLRRVPHAGAVTALRALGVETLVVHPELFLPRRKLHFEAFRDHRSGSPGSIEGLQLLGESETLQVYRLTEDLPEITSDPSALVPGTRRQQSSLGESVIEVRFQIRNPSDRVYREAEPLGYRRGYVTWLDEAGLRKERAEVRFLMPVVLGPGEEIPIRVEVARPQMGHGIYRASLALAGAPDDALGEVLVTIARDLGVPPTAAAAMNLRSAEP